MASLNKKILCFIDEYGTAGTEGFALGCVMVWARECGKVDKAFSDILPASINEVHAANHKPHALQGWLGRLAQSSVPDSLVMLNKQFPVMPNASDPVQYANALIEIVKVGIKRFGKQQRIPKIGNVEVIVDANHHNQAADFDAVMQKATETDGLFRAVNRVVSLDSAASRVLQLADVAAHSRAWIENGEMNAKGLRTAYKIEIL